MSDIPILPHYPDETKKRLQNQNQEIENTKEEIRESVGFLRNILYEEEKKINDFLLNPNFLDIIINEIQNKKVVGERKTIESIFLITNCRNVMNIQPTSSNLLVNDESGLGKDFITQSILRILPKEQVVHRTKITPELFTYWHNPKKEPDWTWDGKVFYLEDAESKIINSNVFKIFSSGGSKATVLIKQKPIDIEIKGKPSMIVTSAAANPNNENLRRYPISYLDDSEEQTINIMIRQSEEDETGHSFDYDPLIKEAIRRIKRVKVIIPYAKKLPYYFPKNRFMRTHFKRFLDYIKSSACLYQYQREKDDEGRIIANEQDYEIARRMLLKTCSNPSMIPLTKSLKDFLNFFETYYQDWFAVSDLESKFSVSDRTLRKWVKILQKYGFLKARSDFQEGVKKPVTFYQFNEQIRIHIPHWGSINSVDSFNTFNSVNSVNIFSGEQQREDKRNQRNQKNSDLTYKLLKSKEIIEQHPENNFDLIEQEFGFNFIEACLKKGIFQELLCGQKLIFVD
jgi:hypothetical protein